MYTLDDVHNYNDLLLKELDRICKKHNINYFMDSGTLIGAVRHKGNIPWDDDVDVTMLRKDYERFVKIVKDELSEGYEFVVPSDYGENRFFDFIPHIAYTKSHIAPDEGKMAFYNGKMNHLLLDIFVLDDASESAFEQKIVEMKLKFIYMLSWAHRYEMDYSKYGAFGKIAVAIMSNLGKLFKQSTLEKAFNKIAMSGNGKGSTKLYCASYPPHQICCVYDKAWFEKAVSLPYEKYEFMAPCGYDKVLRVMFNDYMKLPPKDKQVAEHYDVTSKDFYIE